jgi:hypothetical protein
MPQVSEQGKEIRSAIKGGMAKYNCLEQELADTIGISRMTLSRRMNRPDTFTIKELEKAADKLHNTVCGILIGRVK